MRGSALFVRGFLSAAIVAATVSGVALARTPPGATLPVQGGPAAYAEINADGTIYEDDDGPFAGKPRARGIQQRGVSHPLMGVYCLAGLSFLPRSVVASGANGGGANFTLATADVNTPGELIDCGSEDVVRIRTVDIRTGQLADLRFFVWLEDAR
jgi:hypothetical protein